LLIDHSHGLRKPVGRFSAWALLIAYIGTASAVTGGFTNYFNILMQTLFGIQASNVLLTAAIIVFATSVAYRDVKISARLMLAFEVVSVGLISIMIVATLISNLLILRAGSVSDFH
jgi:amino acid transporter